MKKAVDFDKTLAKFEWEGDDKYDPGKVGEPIPKMVDRVRGWLAQGYEVVILTARVWSGHEPSEIAISRKAIEEFCMENFGQKLEVTSEKSPHIDFIYDDKAIRVEANTGRLIGCTEDGEILGDGIGSIFRDEF